MFPASLVSAAHGRYQFHVHPEAFLVHRPHPKAEAANNFIATDETGIVNNDFRRWMYRYEHHSSSAACTGTHGSAVFKVVAPPFGCLLGLFCFWPS
jgi:hypothetical protein